MLSKLLSLAALLAALTPAFGQNAPIKIGLLSDMNGPSAANDGPGSVVAAKMAIEDFGGTVLGRPIELLSADHQGKSEVGLGIGRKWIDVDGVDAILDANNSALALAIQELTRQKNKVFLSTGAATSDLTGKACSPNGVFWMSDTYALTHAIVPPLVKGGEDSWFFITVNYALGDSMQREATSVLLRDGGKVGGSVVHPTGTDDFSSYLVQAQASGAKVLAFANSAGDTQNGVKQAREFNIKMKVVPLFMTLIDIHGAGLEAMQGVRYSQPFYWELDDRTKAWSKRFFERTKQMPTVLQADSYRALTHYLQAIRAAGTVESGAVLAKMKELKLDDALGNEGYIRKDGRVMRDMYIFDVKTPRESKYPWDYVKVVKKIPAAEVYRPIAGSGCPFYKE